MALQQNSKQSCSNMELTPFSVHSHWKSFNDYTATHHQFCKVPFNSMISTPTVVSITAMEAILGRCNIKHTQ